MNLLGILCGKLNSSFIFSTENMHFLSTSVLYRGTEQSIIYAGERSLRPDNMKEPVMLISPSRCFPLYLLYMFIRFELMFTSGIFSRFIISNSPPKVEGLLQQILLQMR